MASLASTIPASLHSHASIAESDLKAKMVLHVFSAFTRINDSWAGVHRKVFWTCSWGTKAREQSRDQLAAWTCTKQEWSQGDSPEDSRLQLLFEVLQWQHCENQGEKTSTSNLSSMLQDILKRPQVGSCEDSLSYEKDQIQINSLQNFASSCFCVSLVQRLGPPVCGQVRHSSIWICCVTTSLQSRCPSWSKGVDLRSTSCEAAWVRTPVWTCLVLLILRMNHHSAWNGMLA